MAYCLATDNAFGKASPRYSELRGVPLGVVHPLREIFSSDLLDQRCNLRAENLEIPIQPINHLQKIWSEFPYSFDERFTLV